MKATLMVVSTRKNTYLRAIEFDYTDVAKGVESIKRKTASLMTTGLKHIYEMSKRGVYHTLRDSYTLSASYARGVPRTELARSGNLERAAMLANNFSAIKGYLVAGIGDRVMLGSLAPYWSKVESGTSTYIGRQFRGFWLSAEEEIYPCLVERTGLDRWINAPKGYPMSPTVPILPHEFYKKTALRGKIFMGELIKRKLAILKMK